VKKEKKRVVKVGEEWIERNAGGSAGRSARKGGERDG